MWTLTVSAENHVSSHEDRRSLRSRPRPLEKTSNDCSELCWLKALGEHIGEMVRGGHSIETKMS